MRRHYDLDAERRIRRDERLWRAHDLLGPRLDLLWARYGVSRAEQAARRRHLIDRGILLAGLGTRVSWVYLTGPLPEARRLVEALERDGVDAPSVERLLAQLGNVHLGEDKRAVAA